MKQTCENCEQWGEPGVVRQGAMRKCIFKSEKSKSPGGVFMPGSAKACLSGFQPKAQTTENAANETKEPILTDKG